MIGRAPSKSLMRCTAYQSAQHYNIVTQQIFCLKFKEQLLLGGKPSNAPKTTWGKRSTGARHYTGCTATPPQCVQTACYKPNDFIQ